MLEPLARDGQGHWAARVQFGPGDAPFAFRPDLFLVPVGDAEQIAIVERLVPGALRVRREPREGQSEGELVGASGFTLWARRGANVPSIVRRLRAVGIAAQPNHVFFADSAPDGIGANPVYGTPVYGTPVGANPVYGTPVYGTPVYGTPVGANPVYGTPVYGTPVGANPVYGTAAYGASMGGYPIVALCSCCGETDRCQCPKVQAAQASPVYPNPAYVARYYRDGSGIQYQLTGARRSQARPLLGMPASANGAAAAWEQAPVRVAIIDTGCPLDRAKAGANLPPNVLGDDVDAPDFDSDSYLDPVAGHGTFIAGLIARVAPGVGVMVLQGLSTFGDGSEVTIAKVIEDLVDGKHGKPPDIINLSLSGYVLDHAKCLHNAIRKAFRQGIVVVASAGNDGISRKAYPAAFKGVVSVAALGPHGPAPFSNWGSWVRACAPGVDVVSTFWVYRDGKEQRKYGIDPDEFLGWATWSGTSFAAPIVAGVIAKSMMSQAISGADAVDVLIDQPGLFRLPCYGTVINELAARPTS